MLANQKLQQSRHILRQRSGNRSVWRGVLAVATAAALTVTAACSGKSESAGTEAAAGFAQCAEQPISCNKAATKPGGQIVYYEEQDIAAWNTNHASAGHYPTTVMLNGLLPGVYYSAPDLTAKLNTDLMAAEPRLTSEEPQTVVYHIRPEAVWSDGTPITADDFVYQFKTRNTRDCPDACASASNSGYDIMDSVVGSDNGKTVTVTWQKGKKYPDWKDLFDPIYPAHLAKTNGGVDNAKQLDASWEYFNTTQPTWSGGPFLIESYTEGQQLILKQNPKWYGATKPALEKVIFKIVTDSASLAPALQNGEVDAGDPIPTADMVTQIEQLPGFHTKVNAGLSFEHIDLNLKNKFLAEKPLREAVLRVISTQGVIDRTIGQFFDEAKPLLNHNYMPGSPGYKDVVSATGAGAGDIQAAKKALTDAGYTGVGTDLKTPKGEDVAPLRFRHTAGQANRATVGLLTQSYLKALGIEVKIEPTEDLSGTLNDGDFDLIVFAWVKTPFVLSGAEQTYGIGSASNFGDWENPEADAILKRAVTTLDEKAASDLLNRANDLMARDYYTLPLYQRPIFTVVRDTYANVRPNTTDSGPTYNISEWGLRTTTAN